MTDKMLRPPEVMERTGLSRTTLWRRVGRRAIDHWLREAARTTGPEHEEAIRMAREIAGMIGAPWAEVMSGETT
jgi:hypothetical protein